MSEDQKPASEPVEDQKSQESNQETQEQYVARKAYEEVSTDMHKFKTKFKSEHAKVNELETKLKTIEESKMKEQDQWKELYEKEKREREIATKEREQERGLYLRSVKMSALKSELGGKVKDVYLAHANVDSIDVNEDGTLSSDSVREVANQFRAEHALLIPTGASANVTGQAPAEQVSNKPKTLKDMSYEEKAAFLKQTLDNRSQ